MDWLQIAQALGIPFVCLAALSYAIWKVVSWCGKKLDWIGDNVARPLVQRVIFFFDNAEKIGRDQASTITQIAVTQQKQTEILQSHGQELKAIREHVFGAKS